MRIIYTHYGVNGKGGWGRTFWMAKGLAALGHQVTLLTLNPSISFFRIRTGFVDGVKIMKFPDFFPSKLKRAGYTIWGTLFKMIYCAFHRADLCIADCGHRITALPCKLHRRIYGSKYFIEWWDIFGRGGALDRKSRAYKLFYGKIETISEINDKKHADAVVVLSTFMQQRAIERGIDQKKIHIVPGGSIIDDVNPSPPPKREDNSTVTLGYIGIGSSVEILLLQPLIDAMRRAGEGNFKLVVYGRKLDNSILQDNRLENIVEERGWIDYTKDTSSLDDIDVFVQLLEDNNYAKAGWPNKLGDYLAFGKPVLLAPYGDLVDFVHDQPGFFLTKYNETSIFASLETIRRTTSSKLLEMGMCNRVLASTISWKERARKVEQIFNTFR